ncbi:MULTISPECIES: hypothetical protein [unclassified Rathayibacter]|uniref:hypothetical protein n=1 Tax=unclassified Rathayibacter TaxID=2609250 RepID=UPI00188C4F5B|nr:MULTISPECIES: hypothetical protein [unclassified Rathayibacter]MBF4461750.1 hypothetical protein [Rathayibacter sp. VKM Ac-2879]MBF4503161.1 hypothetical protein [Rathayibacter sp. VKM Ac-2878]
MTFAATRIIPGSIPTVLAVLRDARTLATWNPALGPLRPADQTVVTGRPYKTVIRGILPAVVVFTHADDALVEYRMRGAGAEERGRWLLERITDQESRVTHTFEHTGPLLSMLRRSFTPVANWRLERLEDEVRALAYR